MKEIIKKIITDFIERELPEIKEREIEIPINSGKVVSIVGARRTGKTFLLYKIIKELRQTISNDRIIYFNFEDDRIFRLTGKLGGKSFYINKLHPPKLLEYIVLVISINIFL